MTDSAPLPEACAVMKSFIARLGILVTAGLIFASFIGWRMRRGHETRNNRVFMADVSKQGAQQAMGGVMMAVLGMRLSEDDYSPLAWYGALFPFEIVLTTSFTWTFRQLTEAHAAQLAKKHSAWHLLQPLAHVGQYGPAGKGDWRWSWYLAQLLQATLLIGFPARFGALGIIALSLWLLPTALNPCAGLARFYYYSGLTCDQQATIILYILPVLGDATQFIVIDRLQAASRSIFARSGQEASPTVTNSDAEEELVGDLGSARLFGGLLRTDSSVARSPAVSPHKAATA